MTKIKLLVSLWLSAVFFFFVFFTGVGAQWTSTDQVPSVREAREFVEEFMEKMGHPGFTLLSYISKEYFESRWLDPIDFKVNSYPNREFTIIETRPPYVDVQTIGGPRTVLRFKVIKERGRLVLFPSKAEKTSYGNWVDPWWAETTEDIPFEEKPEREPEAPTKSFRFENVTVWEKFWKDDPKDVIAIVLRGEVVNQSGVSYKHSAVFQATLYDDTGGVLGSNSFTLWGFRDGQTKPFEVRANVFGVTRGDVSTWKIEFDHGS